MAQARGAKACSRSEAGSYGRSPLSVENRLSGAALDGSYATQKGLLRANLSLGLADLRSSLMWVIGIKALEATKS